MAENYYFESIKGSADLVKGFESYTKEGLERLSFKRLILSDYLLKTETHNVGLFAKLDEEDVVEITYSYRPIKYDPGFEYTDEYRATATLTQYAPQVKFICRPIARTWLPIINSDIYEVGTESYPVSDVDESDIDYSNIAGDLVDLSDEYFEVFITVGDNPNAKVFLPLENHRASIFIEVDLRSIERLIKQLESGDFYHFSCFISLTRAHVYEAPVVPYLLGDSDLSFLTLSHHLQDGFSSASFDLSRREAQSLEEALSTEQSVPVTDLNAVIIDKLQSLKVMLGVLIGIALVSVFI